MYDAISNKFVFPQSKTLKANGSMCQNEWDLCEEQFNAQYKHLIVPNNSQEQQYKTGKGKLQNRFGLDTVVLITIINMIF